MEREKVKGALLALFVVVSMVLVGLIWMDGLTQAQANEAPGYYRQAPTIDEAVYQTLTAEAAEFRRQLRGTPMPHDPGTGQGQRDHDESGSLDSLDMDD